MAGGDRGTNRRIVIAVVVAALIALIAVVLAYGHARLCYENRGSDLETCSES